VGSGGGNALSTDDVWALQQLAAAHRLKAWMFSALRPTTTGPMLEVGAGIGTFSSLLLESGADPLVLLEPDEACCVELHRRFDSVDRVQIAQEGVPEASTLHDRQNTFGYALCQNVLEHIEDDLAALSAVVRALAPGGELAVLVPAHPFLLNRLDRRFGHFRRYTRARLRSLLADAGAEVIHMRSFNLLGLPGWWLAGRTQQLDITEGSLRVNEALVRIWRPLEDAIHPPVGLSLVARARKPISG
jgi:SAM-dependent methyltransferase